MSGLNRTTGPAGGSTPGFACGIATAGVDGLDTGALRDWLWRKHGILTVAIRHPEVDGLISLDLDGGEAHIQIARENSEGLTLLTSYQEPMDVEAWTRVTFANIGGMRLARMD